MASKIRQVVAQELRTTLVVPSIHCPSCISFLTQLLSSYPASSSTPKLSLSTPKDVAVSYLDKTVSFTHPAGPKSSVDEFLRSVIKTLRTEGYETDSLQSQIISNPSDTDNTCIQDTQTFVVQPAQRSSSEEPNFFRDTLRSFFHPFGAIKRRQEKEKEEKRREKHNSACEYCRQGNYVGDTAQDDYVVEVDVSQDALEQLQLISDRYMSGDQAMTINFEGNRARAIFKDYEAALDFAKTIRETIKSCRIKDPELARVDTTLQQWNVDYAIGGITCASCVGSIDMSIKAYINEQDVQDKAIFHKVSLLQGKLSMKLRTATKEEATHLAQKFREVVDDAGFEIEISTIKLDSAASKDDKRRRRAQVLIRHMFCQNCVEKVRQYFQQKERLSLKATPDDLNHFNLQHPSIAFSYEPSQSLNIRTILADLAGLDPAFEVENVQPTSLASRRARLVYKELRSYAFRATIAFLFAVPTFMISIAVPVFLRDEHPLKRSLMRRVTGDATVGSIILWSLATVIQFGVGSIFYKHAALNLRNAFRKGRPWSQRLLRWGSMDTLVALGTSIAYFASLSFIILDLTRNPNESDDTETMTFFDASVFLFFFILVGRVLEVWSRRKTGDAVEALGALSPSIGILISDQSRPESSATQVISVNLLEVGDLVLIPCGSSPPLDSILLSNSSETSTFDESSLSGESAPVIKKGGDKVFTGTTNTSDHPVIAKVAALPGNCLLDNILEVVQTASGKKASIERFADTVTSYFVPAIVAISFAVLVIWLTLLYSTALSDQWFQRHASQPHQPGARALWAIQFAVSCLVVACPCGIGLAAPTAQMAGIGLASRYGILVNGGGEAFQTASRAGRRKTIIVFDKTGTITKGEQGQVVDHAVSEDLQESLTPKVLWKLVDQLEQSSTHPIASTLRQHAKTYEAPTSPIEISSVQEIAGKGLSANFTLQNGGTQYLAVIGNAALVEESFGLQAHGNMLRKILDWQRQAKSVIYVAVKDLVSSKTEICLVVAISDPIRPEAKEVIKSLEQQYSAETWIISGDAKATVEAVAREVNVSHERVVHGVLPTGKQEWLDKIRELNSGVNVKKWSPMSFRRRRSSEPLLIYVGDGINDAPALVSADVGVAMGSGSSVAANSADFILMQTTEPLKSLPALLSLSRSTANKIYTNFAWACIFNIVLIPVAAGVLVPVRFTLGPSWSGLAMALSSITVVLNALTLRFWRPPKM